MIDRLTDFYSRIISVFSTFVITDFLDIVLVAVIIYLCIRIIRETRAMQLVKGLALLLVVYGVVTMLNMEASSYIFKTIFSNILLIVVILFSPELRKILEQVGKGATGKSLKTIIHPGVAIGVAEISDSVKAVCKACSNMSDKNTGALIVFENETLIGDVIDSGTPVDAKTTTELIENIFFPKSPLHDGAIIIRDGRVFAAGCILPITKKDISSSLGTRHRAGMGITEQSDSIAVMVSEETGAISVAKNGVLSHDISVGLLRDMLMTKLVPSGSSSDDKIIARLVRRIKK